MFADAIFEIITLMVNDQQSTVEENKSENKTCPECGAVIEDDDLFCVMCGHKFE